MYTGLLHTHSFLRWMLLILLITVVVKSIMALTKKQAFTPADNRMSLLLFSIAHLQFLVGIVLYMVSPIVQNGLIAISSAMKDPELRFYVVEHGFAMVIAITLITIGRIVMKKAGNDQTKHKRLTIYNAIALLIVLWAIPWGRF